ncbi:MAG: DNA polymerase III subunit delta [Paludibacter sp.]|jgi:DNA polymerase-3 subunit delta|nr:DNA polymerase III subunit delta [Paludibacter sp.]
MAKTQGITYQQIIADLNAKAYKPLYLLMGEETYYIDLVSDYLQHNILDEAQQSFDLHVLYGKDIRNIADVIHLANTFPMMSPRKIVIIKEAQEMKKNGWDKFENYTSHFSPQTILAVCFKYAKPDGRTAWVKDCSKNGVVFESNKLYENAVGAWIRNYVQQKKLAIDSQAETMIVEYLGNDLQKIANEIDKLIISLPANRKSINVDDVKSNIGMSKDFNVFELQDALIAGNVLKVNRIVKYFGDNPKANPIQGLLPMLFSFFANLMIYHYLDDKSSANVAAELHIQPLSFIIDKYRTAAARFNKGKTMKIIGWIRQTDARSKGVDNSSNTDDVDILKELVFRILH